MNAPAAMRVPCWRELAAERKLPGVLHACVARAAHRAISRDGEAWAAHGHPGMTGSGTMRNRVISHAAAQEAPCAMQRSAWAAASAAGLLPASAGKLVPAGLLA